MSRVRTFSHDQFPLEALKAAKGDTTVSVVVPARNEAGTIGSIVTTVAHLTGLVDELVVVDDGSTDSTVEVAAQAGARVVAATDGPGKGQAMADGAAATTGDVVLFLDADVTNFERHFVTGLLGPLLTDPAIALVKGAYRRPFDGVDGEGGRVTELVARPLLQLEVPELATISQPLAGETGIRRALLDKVGLARGYAVELALLIDTHQALGVEAIAEVELGTRTHRHQSLAALAVQSRQIIEAVLERVER